MYVYGVCVCIFKRKIQKYKNFISIVYTQIGVRFIYEIYVEYSSCKKDTHSFINSKFILVFRSMRLIGCRGNVDSCRKYNRVWNA